MPGQVSLAYASPRYLNTILAIITAANLMNDNKKRIMQQCFQAIYISMCDSLFRWAVDRLCVYVRVYQNDDDYKSCGNWFICHLMEIWDIVLPLDLLKWRHSVYLNAMAYQNGMKFDMEWLW